MTVLKRWAGACVLVTGLTGVVAAPVAARDAEGAGAAGSAAATAATAAARAAAPGETISTTLHDAVDDLPSAIEAREGYQRTAFRHWVDADRDGCNTRQEVLIAEAVVAPAVGDRCALTGGTWYSYYDDLTWEDPSRLDIDHMVPLAEAWDSGASGWTPEERQAYANDLDEPRALVAVTGSANRSKADQDPGEWMPPDVDAHCRYLTEWMVVKLRWGLSVDPAEQEALDVAVDSCEDTPITVVTAR